MRGDEYPYELTTTMTGFDMPYLVYGRNKKEAMIFVKSRLRKGERVISLERVYKNPTLR